MQKKQKTLVLSILISVIAVIAVIIGIWFFTRSKAGCSHSFDDFTLDGKPTYTTSATATRTCRLCDYTEILSIYAATGLEYQTDQDGITSIVNADGFTGKVLYLAANTKDGKKVDAISDSVFGEKNFAAVFIEQGIHTLGDYAFAFCPELTTISLPASLATFGDYTFAGCSELRTVHFANGYQKLGTNQFYECTALTEITLPEGIAEIPHGTFFGCASLQTLRLPETLTAIGGSAFTGCSALAEIDFPAELKQIYPSAFAGCSSLTSLVLPALDTLAHHAFLGCTGLRAVYLPSGIRTIETTGADGPFFACSEELVLYTDAEQRPDDWAEHFNSYNSAVSDDNGGELDDDAYFNLKVVYNCSPEDFPGK